MTGSSMKNTFYNPLDDCSSDFLHLIEEARSFLHNRSDLRDFVIAADNNQSAALACFWAGLQESRLVGLVEPTIFDHYPDSFSPTSDEPSLLKQKIWRLKNTLHDITHEGAGLLTCSSGSTGRMKAIQRSYQSWLMSFAVLRNAFSIESDEAVALLGAFTHSTFSFGASEALERNVPFAFCESFSPRQAYELCTSSKARIVYATPAHLQLLARTYERRKLSPLYDARLILCSGAKLDYQTQEAISLVFPNAEIIEFYGASETSFITFRQPDMPVASVGKVFDTVTLDIRNPEGHSLPVGESGEIWVKSPMLFDGYCLGEEPLTRWHESFLTVGDHGYLDENGYLYLRGRGGAMVTIAGHNVFLDDVQRLLKNHLPWGEAAVIALADPLREHVLVAACEYPLRSGEEASILRAIRKDIGSLKTPRQLQTITDWPLLSGGKTDMSAIREHFRLFNSPVDGG